MYVQYNLLDLCIHLQRNFTLEKLITDNGSRMSAEEWEVLTKAAKLPSYESQIEQLMHEDSSDNESKYLSSIHVVTKKVVDISCSWVSRYMQ